VSKDGQQWKVFFFLLFVVKDCGLTSSDLHLASICKNLNLFRLAVMIYDICYEYVTYFCWGVSCCICCLCI